MNSIPIQPPIFFKNPTVATILSIVTGMGQLYNGQIIKAILFFGSMFIAVLLMSPWTLFIGFLFAPIIWIWNLVDANHSAKRINQRLAAGASPLDVGQ
jgi:TM2 domain-containing membrane protein YozV